MGGFERAGLTGDGPDLLSAVFAHRLTWHWANSTGSICHCRGRGSEPTHTRAGRSRVWIRLSLLWPRNVPRARVKKGEVYEGERGPGRRGMEFFQVFTTEQTHTAATVDGFWWDQLSFRLTLPQPLPCLIDNSHRKVASWVTGAVISLKESHLRIPSELFVTKTSSVWYYRKDWTSLPRVYGGIQEIPTITDVYPVFSCWSL